MNPIFVNSKNSNKFDPQILSLDLTNKTDLRRKDR